MLLRAVVPLGSEVDSGAVKRLNLPSFEHTKVLGSAESEPSPDGRPVERVAKKNQKGEQEVSAFAINETLPVG